MEGPRVQTSPASLRCVLEQVSKNINPSLVLVQPRKTHPFITERLLMGRKESNQTKTKIQLIHFCSHRESKDIDRLRPNFRPLISLDMSAWTLKGGFLAMRLVPIFINYLSY